MKKVWRIVFANTTAKGDSRGTTDIRACGGIALSAMLFLSVVAGQAKLETKAERESELLRLAARSIENLTANDTTFLRSCASGNITSLPKDDNVLRATTLSWVCRESRIHELIENGLRLQGVRIMGRVELDDARIPFPFSLSGCTADGLSLRSAEIVGDLELSRGFTSTGIVDLSRATIHGDLDCRNGTFVNAGGVALNLEGAEIRGSVAMNWSEGGTGFTAKGEVKLMDAVVGGILDCRQGKFCASSKGYAINADRVEIKSSAHLDYAEFINGEVRFPLAKINGDLVFTGCVFQHGGGRTLVANAATIGGSVLLCSDEKGELRSDGELVLRHASIRLDLFCDGGTFRNPNKVALNAESVSVLGSVFFQPRGGRPFFAAGEVKMLGASIGGDLVVRQLESTGFLLRLELAKIGSIADDLTWPALAMNGLVYDRFNSELDPSQRIDWLVHARTSYKRFTPQPYEQLAKVLRSDGHESVARKALIAKQEDPQRLAALGPIRRSWHHILGWTIRYGYEPWIASIWIVAFIVLGRFVLGCGPRGGVEASVDAQSKRPSWLYHATDLIRWLLFGGLRTALKETKDGSKSNQRQNAFLYSVDAFLPIIDFHQARTWLPSGGICRAYLCVHIAFGWILTSLLVAGLTGLVQ